MFDEPLSNLDAALRAQMRVELTELHERIGATMIYVTHDQVEAMTMADQIVVLNCGHVEQAGVPMDLYNRPATPFVAGFIGSPKMNLYTEGPALDAGTQVYGIRPEHLTLSPDAGKWSASVLRVERLGADALVYLQVPSLGSMAVRTEGDVMLIPGDPIFVSPQAGCEHRF